MTMVQENSGLVATRHENALVCRMTVDMWLMSVKHATKREHACLLYHVEDIYELSREKLRRKKALSVS